MNPLLHLCCTDLPELDGSSVVYVPGPSLEGPGFHSRKGQFFFACQFLSIVAQIFAFLVLFDMSSPEVTQTTEASQESQDSQKSSRNKETTRSTADCLQWAIGEGIGDHLSLTDSQGESQNGKLNCNLCAVRLSTKEAILKDHVLGKNVKQPDGLYARKPGTHARKAAVCPVVPPQKAEATPQQPPTIIVNVPAPQPEPAPAPQKKAATGSSVLEKMLQKGSRTARVEKDITRAFSSLNVPLEKLGHVEMKEFFAKYLAQYPLVHRNNYRGTWLPKVGDERRADIERIFRKREHFIVIFADESDDPRTNEEYQLAINVLLLPKEFKSESAGELAFHLDLKSPRREVVRSSAGAGVIYPPFLGSFA